MAISPISVSRISQNMRTDFVVDSVRQSQRSLFLTQSRLASGRSFVSPSEDPLGAARALDLTHALGQQEQFRRNLQHGDNTLAANDAAIGEIGDLLIEASRIASQNVSNLTSADERASEAELVAAIRSQLQVVGNRQFGGRYLFGGRDTQTRPFVDADGGIAYVGDTGERFTRVEQGLRTAVNLPGNLLFNALSSPITENVDLTPKLTDQVRLDDLTGATGLPLTRGVLVINEIDGAGPIRVDLADSNTLGEVAAAISAAAQAAGSTLAASISDTGLVLTPGGKNVTVSDTGGGAFAAALGVRTDTPTSSQIDGAALTPRVTRLTPIADLAAGAGVDLEGGLTITSGSRTVTIDTAGATTVQDLINALNNSGAGILARINDEGTGIDVFNQISGTDFSIGENGGTTAAELGIRTFNDATPLASLNLGRGVALADNAEDLRITAKNGSTVDVDLDGATTIGDVITLINEAATDAGVNVEASLTAVGNGIRIDDSTGGSGDLIVSSLNLSNAAQDLGLDKTATGTETTINGDDVNPLRTNGILDALTELEQALRNDDTQGISHAGGRLDALRESVNRVHGVIGARAQAMNTKMTQMQDASLTTQTFLSEVRDLDYARAISDLQAGSTQLQANLQSSSIILNLTLLDFLR